jgi:RNA polymerase sigma factor for flagellar operon FliA
LEREPTPHELAGALGIEDDELAAYQAHAQPRQLVSFDEITDRGLGEENLPLTERLPDPEAVRPDARLRLTEDRRSITRCINRLPKTQATVIVLHYLQGVPLRDVARLLAVTPARVSQLHRHALARLKLAWQAAICAG